MVSFNDILHLQTKLLCLIDSFHTVLHPPSTQYYILDITDRLLLTWTSFTGFLLSGCEEESLQKECLEQLTTAGKMVADNAVDHRQVALCCDAKSVCNPIAYV